MLGKELAVPDSPIRPFALWRDASWSAVLSGLIAVIIGYAGPTVLVFQVAQSAHLTESQVASWLWAYSIASGITSIIASLRFRMPVITAWSTPGVAFLVTGLVGVPFAEAVGAFIVSNLLITLIGAFGLFNRVLQRIPMALAAALNAGILISFGFAIFGALRSEPLLAGAMMAAFLITRRFSSRWAVAVTLLCGTALCISLGRVDTSGLALIAAVPEWTTPAFSFGSMVSIAIPLTVLALTGQYLPGFAVLKASGYEPPPDGVVRLCGLASILVAPFGCHNVNPSSMIAAIVGSPDTHADPARRYVAAISAGAFYLLFGTFATTFVRLFAALPKEAVAVLAGTALLGAIGGSLETAFRSAKPGSLAPLMVFVTTAAGIPFLGLGAAFWGILVGMAMVHFLEKNG